MLTADQQDIGCVSRYPAKMAWDSAIVIQEMPWRLLYQNEVKMTFPMHAINVFVNSQREQQWFSGVV